MRILTFVVLSVIAVCLFPQEGVTSKIYYEESSESIDDMALSAAVIALVKNLNQTEVFREEKIPMTAMGKPNEMFVYQERLQLFEVKKILKPGLNVAEGETIKTWKYPDYDYDMVRMYYEDGISKSPIIRRQTPLFAINEGDDIILFLKDKDSEKHIFTHYGAEGPEGLETIEKAIKRVSTATPEP